MGRHAYLIMAHDNPNILKRTLSLLDDRRNGLFLHIDKKAKGIDPELLRKMVHQSKLFFVPRMDVAWGGFSQIACELSLLKNAVKERYDYYHLISGVDLPIKSQDAIHAFFDANIGSEFISYDNVACETGNFLDRVRYFHLLQDATGRGFGLYKSSLKLVNRLLIYLQRTVKVDRTRNTNFAFRKGANWFSITHALACFILENERQIAKHYRFTFCADEVFLQTYIFNSPFRWKVAKKNYRLIDWIRGSPYTFRSEDYDALMASDCLYARKFSEKVDMEIVDKIYEHLTGHIFHE